MMNPKKWLHRFSIESHGLYYKLSIIFGLFFLAPVFGFLYFAITYDFLGDNHIPLFFIALLIFSLLGFRILRKLFDEIISVSGNISKIVAEDFCIHRYQKRDAFIIEASIGLGDFVKKGDRINFADSIAKYAVLYKTPLLVEDIDTDKMLTKSD
jgi:hypothetical protein